MNYPTIVGVEFYGGWTRDAFVCVKFPLVGWEGGVVYHTIPLVKFMVIGVLWGGSKFKHIDRNIIQHYCHATWTNVFMGNRNVEYCSWDSPYIQIIFNLVAISILCKTIGHLMEHLKLHEWHATTMENKGMWPCHKRLCPKMIFWMFEIIYELKYWSFVGK